MFGSSRYRCIDPCGSHTSCSRRPPLVLTHTIMQDVVIYLTSGREPFSIRGNDGSTDTGAATARRVGRDTKIIICRPLVENVVKNREFSPNTLIGFPYVFGRVTADFTCLVTSSLRRDVAGIPRRTNVVFFSPDTQTWLVIIRFTLEILSAATRKTIFPTRSSRFNPVWSYEFK